MNNDGYLKGLGSSYPTHFSGGIEWFVTKKHRKAILIARLLRGRKCDVEMVSSKYHTLVKIYH